MFDKENVYGFGRKPQYYKWTTILEHQLFAADRVRKAPPPPAPKAKRKTLSTTMVSFGVPETINPTGTPLPVSAWL